MQDLPSHRKRSQENGLKLNTLICRKQSAQVFPPYINIMLFPLVQDLCLAYLDFPTSN